MAALYGKLENEKSQRATKTAARIIESKLETREGSICTTLYADGIFDVCIGEKDAANTFVVSGNVNTREVNYVL